MANCPTFSSAWELKAWINLVEHDFKCYCALRATYVHVLVLLLLPLLLSVDVLVVPVAANIKQWNCARDRLPRFYKAAPLQFFEQTLKPSLSGWWFGTFLFFPHFGNNHPNWLIFFRGFETTNQLLSSAVSLWRFLRDNRRNRRGNGVSGCAVKETKRVLGLREAHSVLAYWAVERVPVAKCCNYIYIYIIYIY